MWLNVIQARLNTRQVLASSLHHLSYMDQSWSLTRALVIFQHCRRGQPFCSNSFLCHYCSFSPSMSFATISFVITLIFWALFGLCKSLDIEDITWPRGDTKFLFECWKIFHEWVQRTSEIFSTWEEKFRISKRPCNVLLIFIIWTPMKYQTISLKQFFPPKGAIYYVAI